MKESKKEKLDRKAMFIARATRTYDMPEVRKEAGELFDLINGLSTPLQ